MSEEIKTHVETPKWKRDADANIERLTIVANEMGHRAGGGRCPVSWSERHDVDAWGKPHRFIVIHMGEKYALMDEWVPDWIEIRPDGTKVHHETCEEDIKIGLLDVMITSCVRAYAEKMRRWDESTQRYERVFAVTPVA